MHGRLVLQPSAGAVGERRAFWSACCNWLMKICPHCKESLPQVGDGFCPYCRGELDERVDIPRPRDAPESNTLLQANWPRLAWILSIIIIGGLALLFLPLLAFPLTVLGLLGVACIRSAVVDRQTGWISGFIMGMFMLVAGIGGLFAVLFHWLGSSF